MKEVVMADNQEMVTKLTTDATVAWFKSKGDGDSAKTLAIKIAMAIAVLAFVSYFSYTAWKRNKELATTKHELDSLKEKTAQAAVSLEREQDKEIIEKKRKRLDKLEKEVVYLDDRLKTLREVKEYEEFKIEAIKNWDDMDSYLTSIRTNPESELSSGDD